MIYFTQRWTMVVLLSVLLPLVAFVPTSALSAQDRPKVTVSLQIRSGVPNPKWVITSAKEITKVRDLMDGLPNAAPVQAPPFGAFHLVPNSAVAGFPQNVLVFNGVIQVTGADETTQTFEDTKGLGHFLVTQTRKHGIKVPPSLTTSF